MTGPFTAAIASQRARVIAGTKPESRAPKNGRPAARRAFFFLANIGTVLALP
jgi:hypothetical protein